MNGKKMWETRRARETSAEISEKAARGGRASTSRPFKDPQKASRASKVRWAKEKGLQS